MKIMRVLLMCLFAILLNLSGFSPATAQDADQRALLEAMKPRTGTINIVNDTVRLSIPPTFKYLDNADATTFLTKIAGNPLSAAEGNLGVILPTADGQNWFAVLSYSADGHVSDSDASSTNYDDLMKQMKEETTAKNKERRDAGYPGMAILGWAERPYYDAQSKKLFWAKSIQFDNAPNPTLNYDVRVLGRTGYLNIIIVDDMSRLSAINADMPKILSMANFTPGNQYSDYVASTDHTAAYGIAGLVAGGILAKAGFFKGLLVLAAAFWKLIAVAVIGFFAAIRNTLNNLFRRKPDQ